ncbi:hypothetical protein ANO14919_116250 [Xylariales sp. No.14919]|nr:hypothetical protein ANO14919_116250 [Xylariales sp. No.14919]
MDATALPAVAARVLAEISDHGVHHPSTYLSGTAGTRAGLTHFQCDRFHIFLKHTTETVCRESGAHNLVPDQIQYKVMYGLDRLRMHVSLVFPPL